MWLLFLSPLEFAEPLPVATIGEPTDVDTADFTGSDGNDIAFGAYLYADTEIGISLAQFWNQGLNKIKYRGRIGLDTLHLQDEDIDVWRHFNAITQSKAVIRP